MNYSPNYNARDGSSSQSIPLNQMSPAFLNNFQGVSPEILNLGITAGQDIINKQRDRFMPGVSYIWNSLRIYFSVSEILILHSGKNIVTILSRLITLS